MSSAEILRKPRWNNYLNGIYMYMSLHSKLYNNIKMDVREISCKDELDGIICKSYPTEGFGISGVLVSQC
jgi:hypothetical protein